MAQPEARASSAAAMEAGNGWPNSSTFTAVGRGRTIQQQRHRGPGLQSFDDFDEGKGVFADHQGFDAPQRAGTLAQFGQPLIRFRLREHEQRVAVFDEKRAAKFPIAEMRRDEQHTLAARVGGGEMLPAVPFAQPAFKRHAAFITPQVGDLEEKFRDQFAPDAGGLRTVAIQNGQQILNHNFAPMRGQPPVNRGQPPGKPGKNRRGNMTAAAPGRPAR